MTHEEEARALRAALQGLMEAAPGAGGAAWWQAYEAAKAVLAAVETPTTTAAAVLQAAGYERGEGGNWYRVRQ